MGMFQTIGSNERYGILEVARQRTVAAAGNSQATGTLVGGSGINWVTGADATVGVTISKRKNARQFIVYSNAATNALPVYPPVGGTINNGSANAAFSLPARVPALFMCQPDGLTWIVLVNS